MHHDAMLASSSGKQSREPGCVHLMLQALPKASSAQCSGHTHPLGRDQNTSLCVTKQDQSFGTHRGVWAKHLYWVWNTPSLSEIKLTVPGWPTIWLIQGSVKLPQCNAFCVRNMMLFLDWETRSCVSQSTVGHGKCSCSVHGLFHLHSDPKQAEPPGPAPLPLQHQAPIESRIGQTH